MHHTVLCIHLNKGVALMNQYHSNAQQPSAWRFFVDSLVGILCFFIPFTINGNNTIFVDHVHLAIRSIIGPLMPYVALIMILIGTALPIVRRTFILYFNHKLGHYIIQSCRCNDWYNVCI